MSRCSPSGRDVVSLHLSAGNLGHLRSRRAGPRAADRGGQGRRADPRLRLALLPPAGWGSARVAAANAAAGGGGTARRWQARAKEARAGLKMWFAVDTLEYLRRGGRIGGARAWIGSALKIKPILTLEEEITPVERVRTRARALERLRDYARQRHESGADAWVVQHIQDDESATALADDCREIFGQRAGLRLRGRAGARRPRRSRPARSRQRSRGGAARLGGRELRGQRDRPRPPRDRRRRSAGVLLELGGNIDDSQMSILHGHFAVMLVVSVPDSVERERAGVAPRGGRRASWRCEGVAVCELDRPLRRCRADPRAHRLRRRPPGHRPRRLRGARRARRQHHRPSHQAHRRTADSPVYVMMMEISVPAGVAGVGRGTGTRSAPRPRSKSACASCSQRRSSAAPGPLDEALGGRPRGTALPRPGAEGGMRAGAGGDDRRGRRRPAWTRCARSSAASASRRRRSASDDPDRRRRRPRPSEGDHRQRAADPCQPEDRAGGGVGCGPGGLSEPSRPDRQRAQGDEDRRRARRPAGSNARASRRAACCTRSTTSTGSCSWTGSSRSSTTCSGARATPELLRGLPARPVDSATGRGRRSGSRRRPG